jgi:hypothetical protein
VLAVKLSELNPGTLLVDIAAAAVKKIRNRPGAVARRAAKAARKKAKWQDDHPADEIAEIFNTPPDEVSMNAALLLPVLGSIARTFLPAATAFLAGMGIQVDASNPWLTLGLAVAVYAGMQVWSIARKVRRNADAPKV